MALGGGVLGGLWGLLFGGGRNVVAETVGVFRENAEAGAIRDAARESAALAQFAAEFAVPRQSLFDRVIDGLNRIPRPAMALGTLGLFVSAMVDPVWFAARMQGVALVPEPLWWLLGAVVSFYFGARHQAKTQEFQNSIATTLARAPQVTEGIMALEALAAGAGTRRSGATAEGGDASAPDIPLTLESPRADNPALADWRAHAAG